LSRVKVKIGFIVYLSEEGVKLVLVGRVSKASFSSVGRRTMIVSIALLIRAIICVGQETRQDA
jgi:hypothetical protein